MTIRWAGPASAGALIIILSAGYAQHANSFAAGRISTAESEGWITFDPSDSIAIFGRHDARNWNQHRMFITRRTPDGWSEPALLPFSGAFEDKGARFSPDGRTLLFSSKRSEAGERPGPGRTPDDLWVVTKNGETWGTPRRLPAPVNTSGDDHHGSVASDGTIYFASTRPGGAGGNDLYRARPAGSGYTVESLGPAVNTRLGETDVFVDPAQRYVIFSRDGDPNGLGGDDLWISTAQRDGSWSAPRNLGPSVNTKEYEYGAWVSRDGRWLFFTTHRADGQADIARVAASEAGLPARAGTDRSSSPRPADEIVQSQADSDAVRQAVLDYVEAIYRVEPDRIRRSVDTALVKLGHWNRADGSPASGPMTFAQLINVAETWNKTGRLNPDRARKEVLVFEVLDRTAAARLHAEWGTDYFQLHKIAGRWKIIHILWQIPPAGSRGGS